MNVLLLAGGDSNEREVSLSSGKAVADAIKRLGYNLIAIDPLSGQSLLDKNGNFHLPQSSTGSVCKTKNKDILAGLTPEQFDSVDVVFLALHGGSGENGIIQSLLDLAGKKYIGSSMTASAIAMDKAVCKSLMKSLNIPTPDWHIFTCEDVISDLKLVCNKIETQSKLPVIIKPNAGGSTVGLTKVDEKTQIENAVKLAVVDNADVLVEQYIKGRELTVSVLNGKAFPVVEIVPKSGLYDYEAKYTAGMSEYIVPAKIKIALADKLQKDAVLFYNEIRASGLARIDYIVDKKSIPYCLELNTLPGLTELSLAPMAAKADGITFDELIKMMIESA